MKKIFLIIFFVMVTGSYAKANVTTVRAAIEDGIGYRSNLLDPANPYAADEDYLLLTLLRRYRLLPEHYSESRTTNEQYVERVGKLLSKEKLMLTIQPPLMKYHYAYGTCETNDYPAALKYMENAVAALGKGSVADRLILGRHKLISYCSDDPDKRLEAQETLPLDLSILTFEGEAIEWGKYILAALKFYQGHTDKAGKLFSEIGKSPLTESKWLRDTAQYMIVRIAKIEIDAAGSFDNVIDAHQQENPESIYYETVESYRRMSKRLRGISDFKEKIVSDFSRMFVPNSSNALESERVQLFREIFTYNPNLPSGTSPFFLAFNLMRGIAHKNLRIKETNINWPTIIKEFGDYYEGFPGLKAYTKLLGFLLDRQFEKIITLPINRSIYGVLTTDAQVIQARSLYALKRYNEAINIWGQISEYVPIYNGLTEIANSYVRNGNFVDFARYTARKTADLNSEVTMSEQALNDLNVFNEFDISPKVFLRKVQPQTNLIRRGFEAYVDGESAQIIYSDKSLSTAIRFAAVEHILREQLLTRDYHNFMNTWNDINDEKFLNGISYTLRKEDKKLLKGYKDVSADVLKLLNNPKDPVALTNLGYFLYKYRRFGKCVQKFIGHFEAYRTKISLWEERLGGCSEKSNAKYVAPIDLFEEALSIFSKKKMRINQEARVLRIMIYCFKGYRNKKACVRDDQQYLTKSKRETWFRRLHKNFPSKASHTPYWY